MLSPGVQFAGFDSQGEVAWPLRSVWWEMISLQCGFGNESQQDTRLADLEEDMTPSLLPHDPQAQDRPVECFCRHEVIDVDGGFDNGLDFHFASSRSSFRSCLAHRVNQRAVRNRNHRNNLNTPKNQSETDCM